MIQVAGISNQFLVLNRDKSLTSPFFYFLYISLLYIYRLVLSHGLFLGDFWEIDISHVPFRSYN